MVFPLSTSLEVDPFRIQIENSCHTSDNRGMLAAGLPLKKEQWKLSASLYEITPS